MVVDTVRVFAWNARWFMISRMNWAARSTFDCSMLLERTAPNWPVCGVPTRGWPESRDSAVLDQIQAWLDEVGVEPGYRISHTQPQPKVR